jgi:hypothetical protein
MGLKAMIARLKSAHKGKGKSRVNGREIPSPKGEKGTREKPLYRGLPFSLHLFRSFSPERRERPKAQNRGG